MMDELFLKVSLAYAVVLVDESSVLFGVLGNPGVFFSEFLIGF